MKPVVFIPEPIADSGLDLLKEVCSCLTPWADGRTAERDTLYEADAVMVRLFQVGEADIGRASSLKVIAKHGVGVDNIDHEAATAAGIPVVYTPDANANAVAEHTLAMMLALARQVAPASVALREGRFNERGQFAGVELAGKTLGVVGLGRVGSRVAQMATVGFQMRVLVYDPYLTEATYSGPATLADSLRTVLSEADFVTLHVALTPETRHLIDRQSLGWMGAHSRLVNTSRGAVIDEAALAEALHEGRLAGAALDVFEEEPLSEDNPLLRTPNTLLTPHISSSTQESLDRMSLQAAQGILDVLEGRTPQWVVNPETLG